MSGGKTEAGAKGGKYVAGTGLFGFDGGAEGGLGFRADGEVGGNRQDRDRDGRIIKCEDTVENINLWTEHNAPISYDMGLKLRHPNISTLGSHGGHIEIYIEKGDSNSSWRGYHDIKRIIQ